MNRIQPQLIYILFVFFFVSSQTAGLDYGSKDEAGKSLYDLKFL